MIGPKEATLVDRIRISNFALSYPTSIEVVVGSRAIPTIKLRERLLEEYWQFVKPMISGSNSELELTIKIPDIYYIILKGESEKQIRRQLKSYLRQI